MSRPRPAVAIAGGGPAGAVAALVLARRGVPVVVLEAAPRPTGKPGETLPPAAAPLLRHLGLERRLAADGHLPSHGLAARWGDAERAERSFLANPFGDGWHLDRRRFEAALATAAQEAGAAWWWGARVERCRRAAGRWRLEVAQGPAAEGERPARRPEGGRRALEVDFVADATGRHARLARRLGARRLRSDRLVGAFALLASASPTADRDTVVEAVEDGWWYAASLAGGRLAACFFSDGDLLDRALRAGREEAWWAGLRRAANLRERIEGHGYTVAEPPRLVPAESSHLTAIAGDGWLALGDAAAAHDPLSGHGITAAMGSGFYGGHAIADILAGRGAARLAYLEVVARSYRGYLELLGRHYRREQRWPEAPFWRRRHRRADHPVGRTRTRQER